MLEQLFAGTPANIGMWRSLVARVVRDDEVAGSNPVIPTKFPLVATDRDGKGIFYFGRPQLPLPLECRLEKHVPAVTTQRARSCREAGLRTVEARSQACDGINP